MRKPMQAGFIRPLDFKSVDLGQLFDCLDTALADHLPYSEYRQQMARLISLMTSHA